MTVTTPLSAAMATLLLCLQLPAAHAQSSRTFVSAASGSDANDCSRARPCRTFQGAHDKTNPDGEITVLDPGGYGSVAITKSVSIVNDGVGEASILVSGGATGITINAGTAGYVNLRGITVQGIGFGGGNGLQFRSGFSLTMENCVIRNHTGNGLSFIPSTDSSLSLINSLVSDNGGKGILLQPLAAGIAVKADLTGVELYSNSASLASCSSLRRSREA